jgi:hypothetical protein
MTAGKDGGAGLRLELGKCYRDADGDVYGPMEATRKPSPYRKTHPFWDPKNGVSFTAEGLYFSAAKPSEMDLVAEVIITDAAGVPEAVAEGSPSSSPSPEELIKELVGALDEIEAQAVCGPIAVDFDEAREMLHRIATLSRKAIDKAGRV